MIEEKFFQFAKGYLSDPAKTPDWERKLNAYPDPLYPVLGQECVNSYQGFDVELPTERWMQHELQWINSRRARSLPPDFPLALSANVTPPCMFDTNGLRVNVRIVPWASQPTLAGSESYNGKGATSRTKESYEFEAITDLANAASVPYPIFWMMNWATGYFAYPQRVSKRCLLDVNNAPLQIYWELFEAQTIAMSTAYALKWHHLVARPEEVMAREGRRFFMTGPNGAPFSPSFPSATATAAGAAAAVLTAALQPADAALLADQVAYLAEFTALGRWAAGFNWICDLIAGLDLGWRAARDTLSLKAGDSPWSNTATNWEI